MANPIAEYADGSRKQWNGQAWVDLAPVAKGYDAAANSQKYQDKLAQARAAADSARLDQGIKAEQEGYANATTADRVAGVLSRSPPTGTLSGARIEAGRALGSPMAHTLSLGFIPTKEQTADLETVQTLGNTGTLGSVGQLKGPLSDRDVAFLKTLQYNPGATPEQNRRVLEAQKWLATRQTAWAAAQRAWTEKLGSPSAVNGQGMSFERWWGSYSADKLPPPGLGKPKTNADLKARSAATQSGPKLLGYEK